jgi:DNA-binding response OmpR family regulator
VARFLVVDDDPSAAKGLSTLLKEDGHEVSPCTAGAEAVETLSRETFDAVLIRSYGAVLRAARSRGGASMVVACVS